MTLSEKQQLFTWYLTRLLYWAQSQGYAITFGEAYRTPEQAKLNAASGKGIANSVHCDRLAIDLNLFRAGKFLTNTEDHRPLGEYWKSLHPLARWGGDFKKPDGNHYSFEHNGRS